MLSWHGKKCRKPDVFLAGALPFCGNCDRTADLTLDAFQQANPPTNPQSPPWRLNLGWPSCVKYSERCVLGAEDGEDLGPTLVARIQAEASPQQKQNGETTMSVDQRDANQELKPTFEALNTSDEIRLLHLKSGNWDDPLHGTLATAHLDQQRLDYEAVSYVWAGENDDATQRSQLFVGDSWDVLLITENCAAALRRLRSSSRDRVLWIDAICIDQNNLVERSHQVGLMRAIYSGSRRCLVFLGEHTDDSSLAMQLIDNGVSGKLSFQESTAINRLFQRKYFFRTWIFQELVSSPKVLVHCGDSTADWYNFYSKDWSKYSDMIQVPAWIKNFELARYRQALDFPRYIFEIAESLASDDRDKVFAILGLFDGLDKQGLVADYNLSTEEVYTGLAAYLLINHRMHHLLTLKAVKHPTLPSWVPDWRSVQPLQWDFHHQPADEVYDKVPELLRGNIVGRVTEESKQLCRDIWLGGDDGDVSMMLLTGFDLGEPRYMAIKQHISTSVELLPQIHKETGALCISLDFLLPLSGFNKGKNFPFVAYMPFQGHLASYSKWIVVSTSGIDCSEDYVGVVPENKVFLHLKRVSSPAVFRIVGHCNLYVAIAEGSDLSPNYSIKPDEIEKRKQDTCTVLFRREKDTGARHYTYISIPIPDIVGVWVSQNWAATLWDAFDWARASLSSDSALSEEGGTPSLKAAYDDYKKKPLEVSALQNGRLLRCIDFWAYSDSWDILDLYNDSLGLHYSQLIKNFEEWNRYKQSVLEAFGRPTLSLLDKDTDVALSVIQGVETYASALMTSQKTLAKNCRAASRPWITNNGEIHSGSFIAFAQDYEELEKELSRLEEDLQTQLLDLRHEIDTFTERQVNFGNTKILWGTRWDPESYIMAYSIVGPFERVDGFLKTRHDAIVRRLERSYVRECRKILRKKHRVGDPDILATRYAKLGMELSLHAGSGGNQGLLNNIKIQCGEIGAILNLKIRMQEDPRIAIV